MKITTKAEILSNLSECVQYKTLWNNAERLEREIEKAFTGSNYLMFSYEDDETRNEIWNAIHCLKKFRQNLKLKPKYQKILDGV